jgi:Spy/CpxP family protein refolding chaperone
MKILKLGCLSALVLSGLLACGTDLQAAEEGAKAGGKGPGQDRGAAMKERFNQMAEKLGLTEEQKTKLQDIQREQFQKMGEMRGKDMTPEQRMEQYKKMREEMEQKVKDSKVLTDEQFAKWKELQSQRTPGGPGAPGAPGQGQGRGKGKKQ